MRANPFESQLERLARTLTDQFGVSVICQGDQAFTDGRRIVLPSLPETMGAALERMVVGFLDHEMSHVAFSDFRVVTEFSARHPGYEGMLNVVEDALIERRAMKRWPGVRANLDAMFRQIRERVAAILAQSGSFHRFCTAVYLRLSHHRDMMGLELEIAGYGDLFDQFPAVRNTRDAAALAEKILERWMKEQPQQRNPQPNDGDSETRDRQCDERRASSDGQSGQPTGAADAASGQESDETKPESSGSDTDTQRDTDQSQADPQSAGQIPSPTDATRDGESEASDGDDAAQPAPEPAPGSASVEAQPASEQEPLGMNGTDTPPEDGSPGQVGSHGRGGTLIGGALAEAIADRVARCHASSVYRVFTKEHDRVDIVPSANDREVRELLQTGADEVRRLRRGLANALRSSEKRWWREDQGRGVLSPRTLHRLCIDQPRLDVFRTRSVVQGRSTAVSLVLDASGSMTSQKMDVARSAVRVLLEALDDLRIATEAITFTTGHAYDLNRAALACGEEPAQLRDRFSRFGNLEIGLLKRFEDPLKSAMRRLPSIRGTGLTPLGEAMVIGARRLVERSESRRLMLVVTDGKAGCESRDDAAHAHAIEVAGKIVRTSIELIGIGIKDDSLCEIVADTIVVHELKDLPAQLCKLLGRTLRKGMRHVG